MPEISIRDATENTGQAISNATSATTELVQNAGKATTRAVIEKANDYKDIYSPINDMAHAFWERIPYLIIALCVFAIFWLLSRLFKFFVRKTLGVRATNKQNLVLVLNRIGATFIVFFGFMIALVIAIPGFTPGQLVSGLGIGSVAIGFAFKDIFQNMLSGILLLLSEPFRIGDEILSGSYNGIVENIQIRATYIRTFDGRRIVIPNSELYTTAVTVNTAYIKRRCSFDVGVHYATDINYAKEVILKTLDKDRTIESTPAPVVMVQSLGDFAIILRVQWWIDRIDVGVLSSHDLVQEHVKQALDAANITIPFPTHQLIMEKEVTPDDADKPAQVTTT